jgi:hypothetical protein
MAGRPSSFRPEYCEQAEKLCRLGAIDRELAGFFGVHEDTINAWKIAHPEFSESLKRGKVDADAEVAEKLFRRATGYEHEAVKIFMPSGAAEPVYAPYTEHYPPDTTAGIFWLKNRRPDLWRDAQAREHSVPGAATVEDQRRETERRRKEARAAIEAAFGDVRPENSEVGHA